MVRSLAFTLALALAVGAAGFDFDDEADVPAAGAAQAAAAQPKAEVVSKSVPLQHRIGEAADFTERSKLWYRELATGGGLRVRIAQGKLAGPELAAFEKLVQTGGFYTLKLPSVLDDASSPPVRPTCFGSAQNFLVCLWPITRHISSVHGGRLLRAGVRLRLGLRAGGVALRGVA